jgi:hypothetical protein
VSLSYWVCLRCRLICSHCVRCLHHCDVYCQEVNGGVGVLDRAEGLRQMPTSAGCLVGKAGRRLLVSRETEWGEWVNPARGAKVWHTV